MGVKKKMESKKQWQQSTGSPVPSHHRSSTSQAKVELDVIERLKSNIYMLDDLQSRLGFMNQELESLLRNRKKS